MCVYVCVDVDVEETGYTGVVLEAPLSTDSGFSSVFKEPRFCRCLF